MIKKCQKCSGEGHLKTKVINLKTREIIDATVPCDNCECGIVETEEWYGPFEAFGIPVKTDVKIP